MSHPRLYRVLAAVIVAAALLSSSLASGERRPRPALRPHQGERQVSVLERALSWLTGHWMGEGVVIDPNGVQPATETTDISEP